MRTTVEKSHGDGSTALCNEGYQSSLVAATLTEYGLTATDVIGGARAWIAAGFPVSRV